MDRVTKKIKYLNLLFIYSSKKRIGKITFKIDVKIDVKLFENITYTYYIYEFNDFTLSLLYQQVSSRDNFHYTIEQKYHCRIQLLSLDFLIRQKLSLFGISSIDVNFASHVAHQSRNSQVSINLIVCSLANRYIMYIYYRRRVRVIQQSFDRSRI